MLLMSPSALFRSFMPISFALQSNSIRSHCQLTNRMAPVPASQTPLPPREPSEVQACATLPTLQQEKTSQNTAHTRASARATYIIGSFTAGVPAELSTQLA